MNTNQIIILFTCLFIFLLFLIYTCVPQTKSMIIVNIQHRIPLLNDSKWKSNRFEVFSKSDYDNQTRIPSKNVIVFLVASPTGNTRTAHNPYPILLQKLLIIDKHFDDQYATDIIIFHTGYPLAREMIGIFDATRRQVHFINIDSIFYRFPPGFSPHITDPNWTRGGKWNYHHMSYFWFKQIFELKYLRHYKYMLRMDDDSKMRGLWSDVFEVMNGHEAIYLMNDRDIDLVYVFPGIQKIRNFTVDFINKYNIKPTNPDLFNDLFKKIYELPTFLTHFEVVNLVFMQRADVKMFIDAVDRSQGIFLYRWSDALLRYIQMALFANPKKILNRKDLRLSYCHRC